MTVNLPSSKPVFETLAACLHAPAPAPKACNLHGSAAMTPNVQESIINCEAIQKARAARNGIQRPLARCPL